MQIETVKKLKPGKKNKRKFTETSEVSSHFNAEDQTKPFAKKKKKSKLIKQPDRFQISKSELDADEQTEPEEKVPGGSKDESNRQKKRKKHEKLLAEKKLLSDVTSQQKALNYLSQWKHNREGWKFEKLRQVWLQQNLFSTDTIPEKHWETALEYFSNSKGQSKDSLIKEAMKIIKAAEKDEEKNQVEKDKEKNHDEKDEENNDMENEEEVNEESNTKLNRAREILQHLQE